MIIINTLIETYIVEVRVSNLYLLDKFLYRIHNTITTV